MAEPKHLQTPEQLVAVLNQLLEHKVSDIYVCAGKTVHVRTNGEVRPTSIIAPDEAHWLHFMSASILGAAGLGAGYIGSAAGLSAATTSGLKRVKDEQVKSLQHAH